MCHRTRVLLAAACAALLCRNATATIRTWQNASGGSFETASNWSGNVFPSSADTALFHLNDSGYTVTFGASHSSTNLDVNQDRVTLALAGFTYTLSSTVFCGRDGNSMLTINNGTLSADSLIIADNSIGVGGTVLFGSGGIGTFGGEVDVGFFVNDAGTLMINSGADLTCGDGHVGVLGTGFATVSGAGSTWTTGTLNIAESTSGSLTVLSGGSISSGLTQMGLLAVGTALISGTGSRLDADLLKVGVGNAASITVSTSGTLGSVGGILGDGTLGVGTATVTGFVVWTNSGSLLVGNNGAGTLVVNGAGDVSCTAATLGSGSLSTGFASVSNSGSSWIATGTIIVGDHGTGTVNVTNGGTVSSASMTVANQSDGSGNVLISGTGSRWTSASSVSVGPSGDGTLTLDSGGTLGSTSGLIGANSGGVGTVLVAGGATWTDTGLMRIGDSGLGTLSITGSGKVSASSLNMGNSSGGIGTLLVSDPGSSFTTTLQSFFGISGRSTATVQLGANVNSGSLDMASGNTSGVSTMVVDGVGSSWVGTGRLHLGAVGDATITVRNGGAVSFAATELASSNFGSATLLLTGNGSSFTSAGEMDVGGGSFLGGGVALITINPGTSLTVSASNQLKLWTTGTVNLNGGTLSTGFFNMQGGVFNWNSGTVVLTNGGGGAIGSAQPFLDPVDLTSGKTLRATSTLLLLTNGLVTTDGGNLFAGTLALNAAGELLLNSRTSVVTIANQITNSGLIDGDGRISGALVVNSSGEVRADSGKRVTFLSNVPAATNNGKLNLLGGILEFGSAVNNNINGRIIGRGTLITTQLNNSGTISLSAGFSDVFGPVINANGSRVIVTGGATATFYEPVTNNAGSNFQVSTGSTAVFLSSVSGTSNFSGPGVKDFEGNASPGPVASLVGDTFVGFGGNLTATHIREDDLTVEGTATIATNGTSAATSRVNTLTIDGRLDLNDNDLVIDYSGASPINLVRNDLVASYHNGLSNGTTGIGSSAAQVIADDTGNPHKTALGFAEASALGLSSFSGQSVDTTALLIRYTWSGDANLDGVVNALDFNALASNFGGASGKLWYQGDFNYDGVTNTLDFTALASNFNQPLLGSASLGTLIPEPAALLTAAIFALAQIHRIRRK